MSDEHGVARRFNRVRHLAAGGVAAGWSTILFGFLPLVVYGLVKILLADNGLRGFRIVESGDLFLFASTFLTVGWREVSQVTSPLATGRKQLLTALILVTAVANAQMFGLRLAVDRDLGSTNYIVASYVCLAVAIGLCVIAISVRHRDRSEFAAIEEERTTRIAKSVDVAVRQSLDFDSDASFAGVCQLRVDGTVIGPKDEIFIESEQRTATLEIVLAGLDSGLADERPVEEVVVHGSRPVTVAAVRLVPESATVTFSPAQVLVHLDEANAIGTGTFRIEAPPERGRSSVVPELVVTILVEGRFARSLRRRIVYLT